MKELYRKTNKYFLRLVESYVIWLKCDLQISQTIRRAREGLVRSLSNESVYKKELTDLFKGDRNRALRVLPTDSSLISIVKKTANALKNAETIFTNIENMDMGDENSAIKNGGAFVVKNAYQAIKQLSQIIETLNHAEAPIREIIFPHLQTVIQSLEMVTNISKSKLHELDAKNLVTSAARRLSHMELHQVNSPHDINHKIATLIASLPMLLSQLEQNPQKTKELDGAMQELVSKITKNFDKMDQHSGKFSKPQLLFDDIKFAKNVFEVATKLVKPLEGDAQNALLIIAKASDLLRKEIYPQLLIQAERMEESMCLIPGTLTAPMAQQIEIFQDKIHTQLEPELVHLAKASNRIDAAKDRGTFALLSCLRQELNDESSTLKMTHYTPYNDPFVMTRCQSERVQFKSHSRLQLNRVSDAKKNMENFFSRLSNSRSIFGNPSPRHLPCHTRILLMQDYKAFQPYMQRLSPDVDRAIIGYFSVTGDERLEAMTQILQTDEPTRNAMQSILDQLPRNNQGHIEKYRDTLFEKIDGMDCQDEVKLSLKTLLDQSDHELTACIEHLLVQLPKMTSPEPITWTQYFLGGMQTTANLVANVSMKAVGDSFYAIESLQGTLQREMNQDIANAQHDLGSAAQSQAYETAQIQKQMKAQPSKQKLIDIILHSKYTPATRPTMPLTSAEIAQYEEKLHQVELSENLINDTWQQLQSHDPQERQIAYALVHSHIYQKNPSLSKILKALEEDGRFNDEMKELIDSHISEEKKTLREIIDEGAKTAIKSPISLHPKASLLDKVCSLQLADKVEKMRNDFLTTCDQVLSSKLTEALNINDRVHHLDAPSSTPKFSRDPQLIKLYRKFNISLMELEQGFRQLDKAQANQGSDYAYYQAQQISGIISAITHLYNSYYWLSENFKARPFKRIIEELDTTIRQQLQNIPIIGEKLDSPRPFQDQDPPLQQDIVQQWHNQLHLIKQVKSHESLPENNPIPSTDKSQSRFMINADINAVTKEIRIPPDVRRAQNAALKSQIEQMRKADKPSAIYSKKEYQVISEKIDEQAKILQWINVKLAERPENRNHVDQISQLKPLLEEEFALYQELRNVSDMNYYHSVLQKHQHQDSLSLMGKITLDMLKTFVDIKELDTSSKTRLIKKIKDIVGDFSNKMTDDLMSAQSKIAALRNEVGSLVIEELNRVESLLGLRVGVLTQPVFEKIDTIYTEHVQNSSLSAMQKYQLLSSTVIIDNVIRQEKERKYEEPKGISVSDAIKVVEELSFEKVDGYQEKFLRAYQKIQPILLEIADDAKYISPFFLRELQTDEDFQREIAAIKDLLPELRLMAQARIESRDLFTNIQKERLAALGDFKATRQLSIQSNQNSLLERLKEQVSSVYTQKLRDIQSDKTPTESEIKSVFDALIQSLKADISNPDAIADIIQQSDAVFQKIPPADDPKKNHKKILGELLRLISTTKGLHKETGDEPPFKQCAKEITNLLIKVEPLTKEDLATIKNPFANQSHCQTLFKGKNKSISKKLKEFKNKLDELKSSLSLDQPSHPRMRR